MKDGIFLAYGMKDIESHQIIDDFTNRFHMPYISSSPTTRSYRYADRFQINMRPDLTVAILDLIEYFEWDIPVHYIFDSDEGFLFLYFPRLIERIKAHVIVLNI